MVLMDRDPALAARTAPPAGVAWSKAV
jgi:hypothetical protein